LEVIDIHKHHGDAASGYTALRGVTFSALFSPSSAADRQLAIAGAGDPDLSGVVRQYCQDTLDI
jgi:hypothetical protein